MTENEQRDYEGPPEPSESPPPAPPEAPEQSDAPRRAEPEEMRRISEAPEGDEGSDL